MLPLGTEKNSKEFFAASPSGGADGSLMEPEA
jgi:hypothetical protein